jgi:hypothetical protein
MRGKADDVLETEFSKAKTRSRSNLALVAAERLAHHLLHGRFCPVLSSGVSLAVRRRAAHEVTCEIPPAVPVHPKTRPREAWSEQFEVSPSTEFRSGARASKGYGNNGNPHRPVVLATRLRSSITDGPRTDVVTAAESSQRDSSAPARTVGCVHAGEPSFHVIRLQCR